MLRSKKVCIFVQEFTCNTIDSIVQANVKADSLSVMSIANAFRTDDVIVTAKDVPGLSVTDTFKVTILPINDPPVIDQLPDTLQFTVGASIDLEIWEYVQDVETPDSLLTYQFTTTNDSLLTNYNQNDGTLELSTENRFFGIVNLQVKAIDDSNAVAEDSILVIIDDVTTVNDFTVLIPKEYRLYQNYPNPFNPVTTIEFDVPRTSHVTLTIYNIIGEKVETILSKNYSAGKYKAHWSVADFNSGIYFYQLKAGGPVTGSLKDTGHTGQVFLQTRKLLFLK